jgi:hypothetical protein
MQFEDDSFGVNSAFCQVLIREVQNSVVDLGAEVSSGFLPAHELSALTQNL